MRVSSTKELNPDADGVKMKEAITMRKTPRKATTTEIVAIRDRLQESVIMLPFKDSEGKQLCEYKEGVDDHTIANAMGNGLAANHVERVRKELFGKLYGADRPRGVEKRLTRVEKHIEFIAASLGVKLAE